MLNIIPTATGLTKTADECRTPGAAKLVVRNPRSCQKCAPGAKIYLVSPRPASSKVSTTIGRDVETDRAERSRLSKSRHLLFPRTIVIITHGKIAVQSRNSPNRSPRKNEAFH